MIPPLAWRLVGALAVVGGAWFAAALFVRLLRRWSRRSATHVDDAFARHLSAPIQWIAPIAAIQVAAPLLPLSDDVTAWLQHAVLIAIIGVAGWAMLRGLKFVEALVLHRYEVTSGDNLHARGVHTQVRAFRNIAVFLIVLLTVAFALMTFEPVRELGAGLLASAGVAGIVLGFAAQRSIATVVAGIQLGLAQPIRIDDVVVIDGHWGRVEEITLTYVVIRVWDLRRLVVPVTRLMEEPFENWTRTSADMLGTVELELDYTAPVEAIRAELTRIVEDSPKWDRKVAAVQVTDVREGTIVVRALVSAASSGDLWDLRCLVREHLLRFVADNHPEVLPVKRARLDREPDGPRRGEPVRATAAATPVTNALRRS